ncbi:MAG: transposase [Bradymonadaceae bacterium]
MAKKKRRSNFTAAQKVAILRRHLLEGQSVSDLCDEYKMQPSQFYAWQKKLFENGEAALETRSGGRERELEKKVTKLESATRQKDEVLAEVTKEYVLLKKALGEP